MIESAAPPWWRTPSAALHKIVGPAGPGVPQTTAEFLHRSAQSYAGVGRAVTGVLGAAIAPFADPPIGVPAAVAIAFCFAAWSLWYGYRTRTDPNPVVCGIDAAVLCALALSQPLLVPTELTTERTGWITPVVSFGVVAMQWHWPLRSGMTVAVALGAALVVGAWLTPGVDALSLLGAGGVWAVVEGGLSRLLWGLVQRGGRIADEVMTAGFEQERATASAIARRADQRLHWSTVHDTAASTLLMVGLGDVRGDEQWLAGQVQRDISALEDEPSEPGAERELGEVLAGVKERAIVEVHLEVPDPLDGVPVPGSVGVAVAGAVGEALENVRRHAGTGRAVVRLVEEADGLVRVTVSDSGAGFDPDAVPANRHGLVLSVRERMARVGGRADVRSAPGVGTVVSLEWSRG